MLELGRAPLLNTVISIPTHGANREIPLTAAQSVVFVGPNGGGKTQLGAYIEENAPAPTHRVAAQRALSLADSTTLSDFDEAHTRLLFGIPREVLINNPGQDPRIWRKGNRWAQRPSTTLLNDFDFLLQSLYAENNRVSSAYRRAIMEGKTVPVPETKFDRLLDIWHDLLPHRRLEIRDASIRVRPSDSSAFYLASQMSDGERVIFYLIGQVLMTPPDSLFIVDEPEVHIHRSIMDRMWDALETERPDCAFVYITHDLEFAVSRSGAQKFALRSFTAEPRLLWDVTEIPVDTGFPEDVLCRIVGSRRPILFVEGDSGSLDLAIYRRVYAGRAVIPLGSHDAVIHAVASFKAQPSLHRVQCAGLIDADDRSATELATLAADNVFSIPTAEIENLLLLPDVFSALAQAQGYPQAEATAITAKLADVILKSAENDEAAFCTRYTRRRIDRKLKSIGLTAKDLITLQSEFSKTVTSIDPHVIYNEISARFKTILSNHDLSALLSIYDNKGMLAEAAKLLMTNRKGLEQMIARLLVAEHAEPFRQALTARCPIISG